MICHAPPVFGCDGCIKSDLRGWARKRFSQYKKHAVALKCRRCNSTMLLYDWELVGKSIKVTWICSVISQKKGFAPCVGQNITVTLGE